MWSKSYSWLDSFTKLESTKFPNLKKKEHTLDSKAMKDTDPHRVGGTGLTWSDSGLCCFLGVVAPARGSP